MVEAKLVAAAVVVVMVGAMGEQARVVARVEGFWRGWRGGGEGGGVGARVEGPHLVVSSCMVAMASRAVAARCSVT